jgi:hypothetical protein
MACRVLCLCFSASALRLYKREFGSVSGSGSSLNLFRVETTTDTMDTTMPVAYLTIISRLSPTSIYMHSNPKNI